MALVAALASARVFSRTAWSTSEAPQQRWVFVLAKHGPIRSALVPAEVGYDRVLELLTGSVERCAATGDRVGYFAAMYLADTETVRGRAGAGGFVDAPAWSTSWAASPTDMSVPTTLARW